LISSWITIFKFENSFTIDQPRINIHHPFVGSRLNQIPQKRQIDNKESHKKKKEKKIYRGEQERITYKNNMVQLMYQ